jgi:hypothetical protein
LITIKKKTEIVKPDKDRVGIGFEAKWDCLVDEGGGRFYDKKNNKRYREIKDIETSKHIGKDDRSKY